MAFKPIDKSRFGARRECSDRRNPDAVPLLRTPDGKLGETPFGAADEQLGDDKINTQGFCSLANRVVEKVIESRSKLALN